jgi:heat-inducible transcriptional repressor
VLSNGQVVNRMLECPPGLTLQDIGSVNESLSESIAGKPLRSILRSKAPTIAASNAEELMASIWGVLRGFAKELTRGALITQGEEFIFGQPEFQRDVAALADLLENLKDGEVLYDALAAPNQAEIVRIGKENKSEKLHHFSIVRQSFFVGENEAGTIAIIGPTRMAYEQGIPLVNYTARALSESLTRFLT